MPATEESRVHIYHPFEMGWFRAEKRFNHATRRQARKAVDAGTFVDFATGWYLCKLFRFFKKDN